MLDTEFIPAVQKSSRLMVVLHGLGDSVAGFRWLPEALGLPWMNYLLVNAPDDYVVATGRSTSVRLMCEIAFDYLGLKSDDHLVIDPALWRPADVAELRGDPSKAGRVLGWAAETTLETLIHEMVDADLARLSA